MKKHNFENEKMKFRKISNFIKGKYFSFDNFDFLKDFQKFWDFFRTIFFSWKKIENFIILFFLNIPSVKFICTKGELLKVSVRYRTWLSDAIRYLTKMSKILRIWVKLHWSRSHVDLEMELEAETFQFWCTHEFYNPWIC